VAVAAAPAETPARAAHAARRHAVAVAAASAETPAPAAHAVHVAAVAPASAETPAPAAHAVHVAAVAPAPAETPAAAPTPSFATPAVLPSPSPRLGHGQISSCSEGARIISAYYADGSRTASGERFDPNGMTAAHRTLPFGTHLKVINPRNGKVVLVRINDRGPFVRGVTLDLSRGAAKAIGLQGTGAVCMAQM
jgi:rare lipoprotein A